MRKNLFIYLLVAIMLAFPVSGLCGLEDEEELDITEVVDEPEEENNTGVFESDGSTVLTVTCTGDFTIGGDNYHHKEKDFYGELKDHGDDINFTMANVRDILARDDMTLVNFEGTLTETTYVPANKRENQFLFNIPPRYVSVLADNSIEAVSLENNHVMDHGDEGYDDTRSTLRDAGVVYSNSDEVGIFSYQGIQIAMLSYLCIDRYGKPFKGFDTFEEKVAYDIAEAKKYYPLVIVSFHWGVEKQYVPTKNQIRLGHLAVDSGADLVIGHHPHRIQPIEQYNDALICYSLGNFCFAGHDKPADMSSILFQARYRIKEGNVSFKDFRIIPIRISSRKDRNDFIPTPFSEGAETDSILTTLKSNGKQLEYALIDYPLFFK